MSVDLVPYLLLLLAIVLGWKSGLKFSLMAVTVAIVFGLYMERLQPISFLSIAVLGLSIYLPTHYALSVAWRRLSFGIFLAMSIAMSNHLLPGFNNLMIYEKVQFSPDSIPFTMFLNFDKTLVGIFIYLFYLKPNQPGIFKRKYFIVSAKGLVLLTVLLMPIALGIHYIRLDLKFPILGWIWILNNLFFVCLAEEGLFRGFIQAGLGKLFPKTKAWAWVSIAVAAILFGLAHYKGGGAYVTLAAFAGLVYGFAYWKSNRIESSILVHFGLNLIHFLAFSYPALIR